jgi:hypothetical protein
MDKIDHLMAEKNKNNKDSQKKTSKTKKNLTFVQSRDKMVTVMDSNLRHKKTDSKVLRRQVL